MTAAFVGRWARLLDWPESSPEGRLLQLPIFGFSDWIRVLGFGQIEVKVGESRTTVRVFQYCQRRLGVIVKAGLV